MRSPTERSLKLLRNDGYLVEVVERWIPKVKIRKDLWGFDICGIDKSTGRMVLVQTTSASNAAARRTKLEGMQEWDILSWSAADLYVHGWRQRENKRWHCNIWKWCRLKHEWLRLDP